MNYTYFIISPGAEHESYVYYPETKLGGNYIKYGDSKDLHGKLGIRKHYLTHNPDIGVMAVMTDKVNFNNGNLGTYLKNYIMKIIDIEPVGSTEWFSVTAEAAWNLADAMLKYDGKEITDMNLQDLINTINIHLSP